MTLQVFTEIQTCMKGFPAKARVVYVPVLEVGSEGRLARACSILLDFDEVIFIKYCYSFGFFRKWSLYLFLLYMSLYQYWFIAAICFT